MNFLHVTRISLASVAENIMTCLWCGVALKISWTSRRMSGSGEGEYDVAREEDDGGQVRDDGVVERRGEVES